MKKILLLCSVVFMFSCANENEVTTQENPTIENTTTASRPLPSVENATDEMFYQYVNSDIYIEVRQLIINFNENLNYLAYEETENQLFTWIETNLSETNFTSVEQARSQWNYIKSRKSLEISQFQNVYEFIVNAPVDEVEFYVHKWIPNGLDKTVTGKDCDKDFDNCTRSATNAYVSRSLSMAYMGGNTSSLETYSQTLLDIDMMRCRRDYKNCAGYN